MDCSSAPILASANAGSNGCGSDMKPLLLQLGASLQPNRECCFRSAENVTTKFERILRGLAGDFDHELLGIPEDRMRGSRIVLDRERGLGDGALESVGADVEILGVPAQDLALD